jgi:hypothetical protein
MAAAPAPAALAAPLPAAAAAGASARPCGLRGGEPPARRCCCLLEHEHGWGISRTSPMTQPLLFEHTRVGQVSACWQSAWALCGATVQGYTFHCCSAEDSRGVVAQVLLTEHVENVWLTGYR